jgi:hypothetical protein
MSMSYLGPKSRGKVGNKNRIEGNFFEHVFVSQARSNGFLVIKMPLGCRRIKAGAGMKLIQVKTPFDYILVKDGKSLFVDCKSFDNDHMVYSYLTEHQIETLSAIEEKKACAGYVVHLRLTKEVYFFNGTILSKLERHKSLAKEEGLLLGTFESFDVGKLLG